MKTAPRKIQLFVLSIKLESDIVIKVCPRSSGDRASASGAEGTGSNPVGGTLNTP